MAFSSLRSHIWERTIACLKILRHLAHLIRVRFCVWCAKYLAFGTFERAIENALRAFTIGMLNAICCLYLAFVSQKPPTSGIVKVKNGKKISNTATVPSYFYDGTIDYCICFLICFIISLSSMSDFSTLYLSSFHLPLSLWIALNSHSLSLCQWLGLHACVWVMG